MEEKEEGRDRVESLVSSSSLSSGKQQNNRSRASLKSESEFNNYESWKHKDVVRCAFKDIVSDELSKIKQHSSVSSTLLYNSSADIFISDSHMDDDLLWDYNDGLHDTTTYEGGDCEDILLEMQKLFYDDLNSHPLINDLDSTWEGEVDEYLAQAVYQHMQLNADKVHREEIWCPICKQGELKEDRKLMYCTLCQLRLNKDNELNLDFLRDRLAEAHSEHLDRGCRLKPRFCIKTEFNLTALYISCEGCDTFEVVI
ncbi:hypothetical protein RIF29_32864 [Crotalaria pallida]|uniref:RPA-interacting protein C-terminal domain-containing protein n=1 Tax=Crotalaria pallida TaxID=3830 RepID=A0AAN9E9B5_CROPI